jgi:DNA-binding HxlR family transcriptional regulator
MTKNKNQVWSGCPIRFGMGVFGDKWTLLIVRDLMFKGKKHYGEFTDEGENIATNVLADRLKKLEDNGIVTKERDPDHLSKFIYRLTDKGVDLMPVMLTIIEWAERYDEQTEVPEIFINSLREDRVAFETKLRADLKNN